VSTDLTEAPSTPPPAEPSGTRRRVSGTADSLVRRFPVWLLILVLVAVIIVPLLILIKGSVSAGTPRTFGVPTFTGHWYHTLLSSAFLQSVKNTAILAVGGTILALIFGGVFAWLSTRTNVAMRPLVRAAGIAPLFLPTLIAAIGWSFLSAPRVGFLNLALSAIGIPLHLNIYSLAGTVFVYGIYFAPFPFLIIGSALSLANPELEEAAQLHGAGTYRTLSHVTFPLLTPAIIRSALICIALSIENFAIPQILLSGNHTYTVASYIYFAENNTPPEEGVVAAVGVFTVVVVLILTLLQQRALRGRNYATLQGKGVRSKLTDLGKWRWPAGVLTVIYVFITMVLPLWALLEIAFQRSIYISSFGMLFNINDLSMTNMSAVINSYLFQSSLRNSIEVAILVPVIGVTLALLMSLAARNTRYRSGRIISYLANIPIAIPPLVLGLCFLWLLVLIPGPIYGSLAAIIIVIVVRLLPTAFNTISGSVTQIQRDLEDSAVVAGASRSRAGAEITMPLLRNSLISAALLMAIYSFHEISAVIFLYTPSTNILSLAIFQFWQGGSSGQAAAACLLYCAGMVAVVAVFGRWLIPGAQSRRKRGRVAADTVESSALAGAA
jgi:iron(III) transport system permease protein